MFESPSQYHEEEIELDNGRKRKFKLNAQGQRVEDIIYRADGGVERRSTFDPKTDKSIMERFDEQGSVTERTEHNPNEKLDFGK